MHSDPAGSSGATPEARIDPDDTLVRTLNRVYYDLEAERYDEAHPEVIEGDAEWWRARGAALLRDLASRSTPGRGLRILDVGCGTGFVMDLLAGHLGPRDLIVGVDQSPGMLRRAGAKLAAPQLGRCVFVRGDAAKLHFRDGSFDMLAANSLLHHCFDYRAVIRELDRVLKPGGYLVLAHEPNRDFFRSPLIRIAASAWKVMGFGMRVPRDTCAEINSRLRGFRPVATDLSPADILRLVEFHSPVEQGPIRIDRDKGFSLPHLLAENLADYTVVECRQYSTFYIRPQIDTASGFGRVARAAARLLAGKGNLFSAVLRKAAP
ncbi:class I SAM-dependent methyltransferase [Candidatus Binatia bacterium]|nr:class I SAM-dependent methyltransferase [Candidatus Binatia bacterium]